MTYFVRTTATSLTSFCDIAARRLNTAAQNFSINRLFLEGRETHAQLSQTLISSLALQALGGFASIIPGLNLAGRVISRLGSVISSSVFALGAQFEPQHKMAHIAARVLFIASSVLVLAAVFQASLVLSGASLVVQSAGNLIQAAIYLKEGNAREALHNVVYAVVCAIAGAAALTANMELMWAGLTIGTVFYLASFLSNVRVDMGEVSLSQVVRHLMIAVVLAETSDLLDRSIFIGA